MAQVRKLSPEQLQEEFDKIQRVVAFTRGFKQDGSPMTRASSKKFKTGDDDVNVEAPSHGVSQEEEVPSQNSPLEDVEVPSHFASTAQHTASSLKKVGTKKKELDRKGVNTSHSTIPIEDGDPEAEHKMCIKYASDADSASDDDTSVNFYDVVDWELLSTGLGSINVFYRKDNSRKCFISLREILYLVTRADLMTIYGRVMTFYQDNQAAGVGLVLWGDLKVLIDSPEVNDVDGLVLHMFVDKKYPLSVNLIERMLDHQLEICHGTVGNELTTAVQLIAFLKKQISDSRRPKAIRLESIEVWFQFPGYPKLDGFHLPYSWDEKWLVQEGTALAVVFLDADFLVADSKFMKVAFGVGFKMLLFNPLAFTKKDLSRNLKYVVPTGRVNIPAGRYVVPTGKDNVIVSTGKTKVIPAGSTILVLVVLCLLRVDSIVS
ncbi:hypothetical protein Tco_0502299 [Tanacetum coccineum]